MDEMNEEMKPKESLLDKIKSRLKMIKPNNNMPRTANNTADFILPRVVEIRGRYYVKVPDKYLRKAKLDHETVRLIYEADLKEKQISITNDTGSTNEARFHWLRDIMWMEMKIVSDVLYNYPDLNQKIQDKIKILEKEYRGLRLKG
jgi:hypothetical protein